MLPIYQSRDLSRANKRTFSHYQIGMFLLATILLTSLAVFQTFFKSNPDDHRGEELLQFRIQEEEENSTIESLGLNAPNDMTKESRFRPINQSSLIENSLFVGSVTHPESGVSIEPRIVLNDREKSTNEEGIQLKVALSSFTSKSPGLLLLPTSTLASKPFDYDSDYRNRQEMAVDDLFPTAAPGEIKIRSSQDEKAIRALFSAWY